MQERITALPGTIVERLRMKDEPQADSVDLDVQAVKRTEYVTTRVLLRCEPGDPLATSNMLEACKTQTYV